MNSRRELRSLTYGYTHVKVRIPIARFTLLHYLVDWILDLHLGLIWLA